MFKKIKPKKQKTNENSKVDLNELKDIDDISFLSTPDDKEEYYYLNGNVCTVLQIKRLPQVISEKILDAFKGYQGVMITFDMEHLDNRKLIDFLDKKMDNMENDSTVATKTKDRRNYSNKIQEERQFIKFVDSTYQNGKHMTMRIYLKAPTLDDLKNLVERVYFILKDCGFFGAIQRNLMHKEIQSMTSFSNPIKDITTTRGITNMIMSDNVYDVKPMMFPLGETQAGLPYCPDFMSYSYRSYCVAILSMQGGGKSSLIKSMVQAALIRKEQVIMLDVHNKEYEPLAQRYHVPSVILDMKNGINPYQIFNNSEQGYITEMTIADTVMLNREMFVSVTKEEDTSIISMYVNALTKMYIKYIGKDVDTLSNSQWFKGVHVLDYVMKEYSKADGIYKDAPKEMIFKLLEHLKMMVFTYGYFFDTYTTMNIDISKSIHFDLSSLNIEGGGQLENAYFSLIFSFLGKIMRKNEKINEKLEKGKKVTRPLHPITVVAEETGTVLKNIGTAKMFDIFMRQTRKARASFIYALHTINDITGGSEEYQALIKSIFGLCSVFIVGQINKQTADDLPSFIDGITPLEAQSAVDFVVSETDKEKRRKFLAYTVDDKKKIVFYSKILPRQKLLFGGGK